MSSTLALPRKFALPTFTSPADRAVMLRVGGGLALAAVFACVAIHSIDRSQDRAAPPAPPPMIVRALPPEQALKVNAQIPIASSPNPAAAAFVSKGTSIARAQALNCLASAVYYEAGNQDADGQRAVAQVVLNRVRHPAFASSICGVVYEGSTRATGCQFTFTCDGSLNRRPDADGWRRATIVAQAALAGAVYAPIGWATHYHADYVVPYWASEMAKNAVIGAHLFYRWQGGWGVPSAFSKTYAGVEPSAEGLRSAALAVPHVLPRQAQTLGQVLAQIPGAEALKLTPSMRKDKKVAVRFNLAARTASEKAKPVDYSKQFATSDNLKWSLSSDSTGAGQEPLGKPVAASGGTPGGN